MKKLFTLLALAVWAAACSDDAPVQPEPPTPPEPAAAVVTLGQNEAVFPAAGGSADVTVSTNQEVWDAACPDKWLSVTKSGDGIRLTADVNDGGDGRTATVTVTAGEDDNTAEAVLSVSQTGSSLIIEVKVPAGAKFSAPICDEIDASIDWGDGQSETFAAFVDNFMTAPPSHVYSAEGTYMIKVSGTCRGMYAMLGFSDEEKSYITRVVQWGKTGLVTMRYALYMCPNLESVPADIDGSFSEVTSFENTFERCSGLKALPEGLLQYATQTESFSRVFEECTGLTALPERLFAGCAAATSFSGALSYLNITEVPENILEGCTGVSTVANMLSECKQLRHVPGNIFADCTEAVTFDYVFRGCHSLQEIPENLFAKNTKMEKASGAFTYCYSLTSIPEKLFANNPSLMRLSYTFADCSSVTAMPVGLFDNNTVLEALRGTFRGCVSMAGESPYTMVDGKKVHLYERSEYPQKFSAPTDYEYCFEKCTGLSDYELMRSSYPDWVKDL